MVLIIKCQLPPETNGFQIYRNPKFIHDRMVHQDHQYVRIKGPYSVRRSTLTCHELTSSMRLGRVPIQVPQNSCHRHIAK